MICTFNRDMGICPMGIPYKCLKNIVKTPENEKKLSNVKIKTLIFSSKDFVCGKITGFPHIRISPVTPPPNYGQQSTKKMFKNLQIYIEKMAISTHLQDPHTPLLFVLLHSFLLQLRGSSP